MSKSDTKSDRIQCQKDTKIIYDYLNGKYDSVSEDYPKNNGILNGVKHSRLFTLALAYGVNNNKKSKIKTKEALANKNSFENYLIDLINAVAIYESDEGANILKENLQIIYMDAQEYANGGIKLLYEDYKENMDGIINDWHLEIDEMIKEKKIFEKINNIP